MGVTKTSIFTDKQNTLAQYAKALAHPARIAILQELINRDSCVCGELVTEIGLAQATISQHLKELKQLNIIKGEVEGTSVCYCINDAKWNEVRKLMSDFFGSLPTKKIKCC